MAARSTRIAALAIALAGCTLLGSATVFGFAFPADDRVPALPVIVSDYSGTVRDAGEAPADFKPIVEDGFSTVPGKANAIVVHWVGGACDKQVDITVRDSGSLTFNVVTTPQAVACDLLGVQRAVLIELARPLDVSRTSVTFGADPRR